MAGIGVIHYKFKSAIQPESVEFDGHYITVGEVKRLIASKKGLSLEDACAELELSENIKGKAGKVYTDDSQQLPRSASVIVRRLPVQRSKAALAGGRAAAAYAATAAAGGPLVGSSAPIMGDAEQEDFGKDPYEEQIANRQQRMAAEDAVIGQVVAAQEQEWQHSSEPTVLAQARAARGGGRGAGRFQGGRGGPGGRFAPGPHGRPHDTYFCALCGAQGKHWKQDCPQKDAPDLDLRQVRAPAGIPSSMLARDAAGGLLLPNGEVGNVITDQDAFAREMGLAPQPRRNVPALPAPRAASPLPLPGPGAGAAAAGSSRPTSAAARAGAGPADAEDADLLQGLQEEQPQVEEEMEDHGAGLFDDEEDFLAPRVPALSGGLGAGMLEAVAQQQEQQRQQQQKQQQQGSEQQEGMDEDAPTQQQQRQPPASPAAALPGQRSPAPAAGVRSATPPSASAAPEPLSTFAELLPYIEDLLPKTWPQDLLEEAFGSDRPLKVAEWGQLTQRLKEQGAGASPKQQQKQRSREEERRREQERGSSRRHGSRRSRSRSRSRSRDGKDKRKRRDRHRSSERSTQPQERRSEREAPPAADTAPQQQEQRPQQQEPAADDLRHQLRKKRAEKQAADAQQQQQQQAAAGGAGEPVARSGEEHTPKKQRTEAAAADRPADELMTGASGELQGLLGEPLADLHLSNGGEDAAGHNEGAAEQQDWDTERGASDREGDAPGGDHLEDEQGGQGGGYSAEGGADPMDWGQAEEAQEGSQGHHHQQRSSSPRPESGSHGDRNGDEHGSMQQQQEEQQEQQEGGSGRSRSGSPTGEERHRSASRSKGEGGRSPSRRHRRHRSSSRGRKEGERRRSHRDKKDKKERRDKEKKSRHKRRDGGRSRSRSRSPSRRRSSKRSRSRSRSPARQQPAGADKPRRPAVERLGSRGSSQPEAAAPGQGDAAAGQAPGKSSRRGGAAKLWQNQLAAGGIGIRK